MSVLVIQRKCKNCGEMRPFEKRGVNHVLHLLLTLVTVGLWAVMWLLLVLFNCFHSYRCRTCGGK